MSASAQVQSADGVLSALPGFGILSLCGTVVPADAGSGYTPGCLFHKVNGTTGAVLYVNNGTLSSCDFNAISTKSSTQTAALTAITATAPVTPDYAIQSLTSTTPFGFVTADEGNTVLSVVANLQARVAQLESRL